MTSCTRLENMLSILHAIHILNLLVDHYGGEGTCGRILSSVALALCLVFPPRYWDL